MQVYPTIGIKQVIRYEWMQHTVKLLLSGMKAKDIKKELEVYLSDKKGRGTSGDRANYTMSIAATILLHTWVTPNPRLMQFRDKLLSCINQESNEKACHWAMISSAYPFWFNISYLLGSLFKLQNQVKKTQIMSRVYELYGERNTVERCSRYVIRSLIAWDILQDSEQPGCYIKGNETAINDHTVASLLLEAALYATPAKMLSLASAIINPAFFIFTMPGISSLQIQNNNNIIIENMSANDEFIRLKG